MLGISRHYNIMLICFIFFPIHNKTWIDNLKPKSKLSFNKIQNIIFYKWYNKKVPKNFIIWSIKAQIVLCAVILCATKLKISMLIAYSCLKM